ncbi:10880_t:CDS:1, partial [Acaulospora colombiana]
GGIPKRENSIPQQTIISSPKIDVHQSEVTLPMEALVSSNVKNHDSVMDCVSLNLEGISPTGSGQINDNLTVDENRSSEGDELKFIRTI